MKKVYVVVVDTKGNGYPQNYVSIVTDNLETAQKQARYEVEKFIEQDPYLNEDDYSIIKTDFEIHVTCKDYDKSYIYVDIIEKAIV